MGTLRLATMANKAKTVTIATIATIATMVTMVVATVLAPACHRRQVTVGESPGTKEAEESALSLPVGDVKVTRGTAIALLYSSNLQGEYENCGCPSHPLGGLVRRATVIDRARSESDGVLIVDAGDLLLPAVFHDDKRRPPATDEVERRARLMLQTYARMGVHAFLPAERDLAVGPARLARLLKTTHVPAVASNLRDGDGRPLFERDRLVTVAGVSFGIFGVVQPQPEDQALWRQWRISAADPTATAREEVASLTARGARVIVALLHLGPAGAAEKLLLQVPGISFAVQGHSDQQLESPPTFGGARLVEAMSTGKLAGRLDLHVVDGATTFTDKGDRARLLTIIADHRHQLAELEKRAADDKTEQLREYYKLRREGISAAIVRETELARRLPGVVRGSWYESQIIPLDESIPDHPGIALLVAAYNAESARRSAARLPVGIALGPPRPSPFR
jgi:2',3'-cyclic-nucleotide 2'-phosphodiesterase (5'-nucleotidase family)